MNVCRYRLIKYRLILPLLLLLLFWLPQPTAAQGPWPPFEFDLVPTYADGRITYNFSLTNLTEWPLGELTIKFPLPEGVRFLEATPAYTSSVK
jgi:hypothetical protein